MKNGSKVNVSRSQGSSAAKDCTGRSLASFAMAKNYRAGIIARRGMATVFGRVLSDVYVFHLFAVRLLLLWNLFVVCWSL